MRQPLSFVRLIDVPMVDDRQAFANFGTTFQESALCDLWRDELGWVHIQLYRATDAQSRSPRAEIIALPPHMVKFAQYAGQELPPWANQKAAPPPASEQDQPPVPVTTEEPVTVPSTPAPAWRHPKSKSRR